jgi:hypothetical protein
MIGTRTLSVSEVACTICPSYVLSCDLDGLWLSRLLWIGWSDSSGTTMLTTALWCLHTTSWVGIHGNIVIIGTSYSVYALGSSRTTPFVEGLPRSYVIHFSQIPMLRASVSHRWGHFRRETSFDVWSDTTFTYLARRKRWIPKTFL